MKKKQGSAVIYLIFFFVLFLAFCAFAVDATIVYTARSKLQNATESSALAAASLFNRDENISALNIEQAARNTLTALKADSLEPLNIQRDVTINVNMSKRQVLVVSRMNSPTFFLGFLGVGTIALNAQALAISNELPITSKHPSVNWITASAAYLSDIISKTGLYKDTAVLLPIGNFPFASIDKNSGLIKYELLDSEDNKPLSLGPGGFITIKLPAPIIDKPGNDLYIKEIGINLKQANNSELGIQEGYMVFAGLDVDPKDPYVSDKQPGKGLKWVNISCTGTPKVKDVNGLLGAYQADTKGSLGTQTKFYGSGYFDIGASCTDGFSGVSMAKYIRIIDDNDESALVTNSINGADEFVYYPTKLLGESSGPTAGADIDNITVLNYVRLAPPSSFIPSP